MKKPTPARQTERYFKSVEEETIIATLVCLARKAGRTEEQYTKEIPLILTDWKMMGMVN